MRVGNCTPQRARNCPTSWGAVFALQKLGLLRIFVSNFAQNLFFFVFPVSSQLGTFFGFLFFFSDILKPWFLQALTLYIFFQKKHWSLTANQHVTKNFMLTTSDFRSLKPFFLQDSVFYVYSYFSSSCSYFFIFFLFFFSSPHFLPSSSFFPLFFANAFSNNFFVGLAEYVFLLLVFFLIFVVSSGFIFC